MTAYIILFVFMGLMAVFIFICERWHIKKWIIGIGMIFLIFLIFFTSYIFIHDKMISTVQDGVVIEDTGDWV